MEAAVRWSPHSTVDEKRFVLLDIVDNALTLNQVDSIDDGKLEYHAISTFNKLPSFAAFDWSKTSAQIVALGHVSGNASLIRLNPGQQTSETVATYRVKQQRRCNSIAFSTANWLAVALDKTRSDVCLNIYDAASTVHDPVRRLCPAELVSSVRFFSQQPLEVLVGAQRAFLRLYDLRDGFGSGTGNLQVPTRNVHNIAIDPIDENYFAAGGPTDDVSVTVWDKRWISQHASGSNTGAVFDFRPAVDNSSRSSVWSLRYSPSRRGRLALCSSTGELKIIDMLASRSSAVSVSDYVPQNPLGGQAWSSNRCVSETRSLEPPFHDPHRGRPSGERLVAFDWIYSSTAGNLQSLLVLRANRQTSILRIPERHHVSINARNELSLGAQDLRLVEPKPPLQVLQADEQLSASHNAEDFGPLQYSGELEDFPAMNGPQPTRSISDPIISQLLAPSTVHYDRCKRGYLFDCNKNFSIVAGNRQLERLWEIVGHLRSLAANEAMIYESLDLSLMGVNGLWSETASSSPQRRLSPSPTKPLDAVLGLNEKREIPPFEGERTDYPEHRQLCLALCGWNFTLDTLDKECQELIDRGLYYQAIVQAVLHGNKHLALNILRSLIRGKTIENIGLGALLAADELNDDQREMTMWMAADTEDPALKALLTYLNSGDWRDIMKTNYLHLGYRVALGLKYLNDTELNGFIQAETARAIRNGDLEGILLTGLTEQGNELFQTYITRTNDLQTAVLATAFSNPLFVDDPRWQMWKETYFMQMQSWRAFTERTRFVVAHNRLAKTREGRCLIEPPPAQVKINCVHCQKEIGRSSHSDVKHKVVGPAANAGTVCLRCGRHLPRCSICTMWLGTPDPRKAKTVDKGAKGTTAGDVMEKMLVFCTKCEHGFHAHHARDWFAKYGVCPSPGCGCTCNGGKLGDDDTLAHLLGWL